MNYHLPATRKQTSPRQAFTVLEVVIAILLIGLIVLAVYGAITSGMGNVRMARENLRATQILLDKMEVIRLYNWDQLNTNFIPSTFIVNYDATTPSTNSGVLFYGTVSLAPSGAGTSYADDMKLVTVRLNWKTGQIARSRQSSTYVCRSGIQNYLY